MKNQLTLLFVCFPMALASNAALEEFTSGNNLFTASVYKELKATEPGNFLISPFSAETVLALTQSGAKDATAQELKSALRLPSTQEKIETAIKSLQLAIRKNDLYTIKTANKIYTKPDFEIRAGFKKLAAEIFDADLEKIDFAKPVEAASTMNQWVEGRTEHKIKNLISAENLNSRTRSVLVNALYFKGNWSSPFEKYATGKQDFFRSGREAVQVDTMRDTETRKYFESDELKAKFLEMPFEGDDVSMVIVLPNEKDGLATLENRIEEVLKAPKFIREYVRISIPKFKVESKIDFKAVLQKLGVTKAFNGDEADLSGIAGKKGDLIIDQVVQKSFVDVNEEGVEAAAASFAIVGVPLSGFVSITPPKEFKADHPFIFYIKVKDLILFAGRVIDPSGV